MKSNFWKKLAVFLGLAIGAVTMTACQTTNTADIKFRKEGQTMFFRSEDNLHKYATSTFYVENNTIFDIKSWDFGVKVTKAGGETEDVLKTDVEFYVSHGAYGTVTTTVEVPLATEDINLTKAAPNRILSAWETYLGWWICGIVIVALAWIFFLAEIIGKKLSSDQIMDAFRANAGGSICVALFVFILCMFPLFFGAWVPTVILVISLLASILGCAGIAGIASAVSKKKA